MEFKRFNSIIYLVILSHIILSVQTRPSKTIIRTCASTTPVSATTNTTIITNSTPSPASVSATCGTISLDTPLNGTFQSPNYPNNYPDNVDCVYLITAPPNKIVVITASEPGSKTEAPADKVIFYNSFKNTLITTLIGDIYPITPFSSTDQQMKVVFSSNSFSNFIGFKFYFEFR